ncbi:MAG TPA: hypothetical protein VLJ21_03460 [Candidatus Binatia bacterium]|nr:hypothetical protein [Candidatus Binatia bacterium]
MLMRLLSGIVLLTVLAGAGYYFFRDAGIDLQHFTLTGITSIGAQGFTINGELAVTSTLKVPVPVQSVAYEVTLERTGETISSGTLPPFVLQPGENKLAFEHRVYWVPTAALATQLATDNHVNAVVAGTVHIDIPGVDSYAIPFKDTVDIKQYVTQFVPAQVPVQTPTTGVTEPVTQKDDGILPVPGLA